MQFVVIQNPKRKYRGAMCSVVAIVEAPNATAAVRAALTIQDPNGFVDTKGNAGKAPTYRSEYSYPTAAPLRVGSIYLF